MFVSGRSGTKVSRRDDNGDADEESSSSDGDNVMSRPVPGGASKMSPSRAIRALGRPTISDGNGGCSYRHGSCVVAADCDGSDGWGVKSSRRIRQTGTSFAKSNGTMTADQQSR